MIGSSTAFLAAFLSLSFTVPVLADSNTAAPYPAVTFAECQSKTANPLQGCPEGTIYVSLNDTKADFNNIQSAILSIPNDTVPYYILVAAGNYYEQLNVTRSAPLYLLGQSNSPVKGKTYAGEVSYNKTVQNDVQIWYNSANVGGDLFTDNVSGYEIRAFSFFLHIQSLSSEIRVKRHSLTVSRGCFFRI